ncbi:CHAT domain-containing protein [Leptolyngbya sp. PCC 6406]|uniref:CHAT domain-containing protein n=1 Tax=Leptolyngbya sp. PCC 6406 TaxID=1173264 RepID=UPI0002AC996E|nr:CHAT domain-containing protein [Leptolyngbya sp. PCC 6406]
MGIPFSFPRLGLRRWQNLWRGGRRWGRWGALVLATIGTTWLLALVPAQSWPGEPTSPVTRSSTSSLISSWPGDAVLAQASPLQTSYELYESGQLTESATLLEETLRAYEANGDSLRTAVALSNLALVRGQLGQWSQAQGAVERAISLLREGNDARRPVVLAQTWTIQGQLYLAQGNEVAALAAFETATVLYEAQGDTIRQVRSRINQAQALQHQGFYRRAIRDILLPLETWLRSQPDSLVKAEGLNSLGGALLVADSTAQARTVLEESLVVLKRLEARSSTFSTADQAHLPEVLTALYISLGNAARSPQDPDAALDYYRQAAAASPGSNRLRAHLNELSLLVEAQQYNAANALSQRLWTEVTEQPLSRDALQGRINFANSLIQLQAGCGSPGCAAPSWGEIESLLSATQLQAQNLGDRRTNAYVTGLRGTVALKQSQWQQAHQLTEQALVIAAAVNATDITYRWHEQLGQIQEAQGNLPGAIAAYQSAVNTLKRLRTDLLAVNPDLQFSFQKSVEPIHRKLVSLLIESYEQGGNKADRKANGTANPLGAARMVIESLQQEELNNYLRAACLDLQEVQIDQIAQAQSAAVIYPIILSDRLATIVSYPGQSTLAAKARDTQSTEKQLRENEELLELYPTRISATEMDTTLRELRRALTNRISLGYRTSAQQVYDWVIRPLEADLATRGIDTLVFVLDGGLRNVPMAALFDGEKFLIEKYAIALTPGLQLLAPQPLLETNLSTLAFGLSEPVNVNIPNTSRQVRFSALPNVAAELDQIQALLPATQILMNEEFTPASFRQALANTRAPIVHLATHGQFSSNQNETFIVASGGTTITIDDLTGSLEATATNRAAAVELLVLSACETAAGDDRAALGLAGIAVRAGARSTLASLWQVDDVATSQLMTRFYETLTTQRVTKAQALQAAQRAILDDPRYRRHPYFWAPFVMVGNWL